MVLSILLTKGHRLLSLAAIVDVFETVNRFYEEDGKEKFFDIRLLGSDEGNFPESFRQYPFYIIDAYKEKTGLLFVPAFGSVSIEEKIKDNYCCIPFLLQQYNGGASIVSLCTGSFLLAASGLLNGREATTHIEASDKFAQAFPEVKLQPHAILTQSENVYTSGGATSSFHMKLMLIQKYCGREMAIRVAKTFAIDMDRNNQLHFDYFKPALNHQDELVRTIQLDINQHFDTIKNVEDALEKAPSSRRNIIRRFKQATGMTPIRYLQRTKIEMAKNLLETTNKDITDIMVSSGYSDLKNFRQLFKSFTGLTPKDYRDKYRMRLN